MIIYKSKALIIFLMVLVIILMLGFFLRHKSNVEPIKTHNIDSKIKPSPAQKHRATQYKNLPAPVETLTTLQTYEYLYTSLTKNLELYQLVTYSKDENDRNDFAGTPGTIKFEYYICNLATLSCSKTDIIDKAMAANLPGYVPGLGYCFRGWDDTNEKIYTYSCGEGGDGSSFGVYDYKNSKSYIVGGDHYTFINIDENLKSFAMVHSDETNKPVDIELYKTDELSKPLSKLSLRSLSLPIDLNPLTDITITWDKKGGLEFVQIQDRKYRVDSTNTYLDSF